MRGAEPVVRGNLGERFFRIKKYGDFREQDWGWIKTGNYHFLYTAAISEFMKNFTIFYEISREGTNGWRGKRRKMSERKQANNEIILI